MIKDAVIRVTKPAHDVLARIACQQKKSKAFVASELILAAKSDADLERQKFKAEIAELREEIRRCSTRKDIATLLYTLAKGDENNERKERLMLGYRMYLGYEVIPDFASISFIDSPKKTSKVVKKVPKLWPKLLIKSRKNSIEEGEF